jgi:hypothetical protein
MNRSEMSACIVSPNPILPREILASLQGFGEIIVGDGLKWGVYGRYQAVARARYDTVYTQDDDCVVDIDALLNEYKPGEFLTNMTIERKMDYIGNLTLIGWGAIFPVFLPIEYLSKYLDKFGDTPLFRRECDRVFTGLTQHRTVFVPVRNLLSAVAPGRLWTDPHHKDYLKTIKEQVNILLGGE